MIKHSTFRVVHTNLQPRAGDLLGGLLGDDDLGLPSLSLPGLDPTSVLGLPNPGGSSTTSTTTSVQATPTQSNTSLTLLSSTTSSGTQTTTTSGVITTSATSSATSAATTTTGTTSSTTNLASPTSDTATSTLPPTSIPTSSPSGDTATLTGSSTSSESPTSTAALATAPKGFLQNKALSVGVITAASLVGLVLIIALATWAIRKRRNDRLHQDIVDFSNAGLVAGSHDMEKGPRDMFVDGPGGVDNGSSSGHGSSLGHGNTVPPPVQPRQVYQEPSAGYGAAAAYMPQRQPSRHASPYVQQAYANPAYGMYQQPNNTYDSWGYGYGAGAAPAPAQVYNQAYGGMEDPYGGYADMQANASSAQPPANPPQRRPSAQRKPAPPLYDNQTNPIAQPADAASPASPTQVTHSTRRTSLLNSPAQVSSESGSGSHDPYAQRLPAAPQLPDEFGAPPTYVEEPRRLMVRNE